MTATTIESAIPLNYEFFEEKSFIPLGYSNNVIDPRSNARDMSPEAIAQQWPGKILDLVSDEKKVFCFVDPSFYHNIHDDFYFIVKAVTDLPGVKIYINTSIVKEHHAIDQSHVRYVLDLLSEMGVEYETVDFRMYAGMLVSNYYAIIQNPDIGNSANDIYDFVTKDLVDTRNKPFRKVYLSRRAQGVRNGNPTTISGNITDNRIDNHDIIENFFRSIGFEIIQPEEAFSNLKDQIKFFNTVKVLVSATSSGLTNSIFMQPGQTVIEIKTPLALEFDHEVFIANGAPAIYEMDPYRPRMLVHEVHHFYEIISLKKNHLHVSIPNIEKNMKNLVVRISQDQKLMSLISELE